MNAAFAIHNAVGEELQYLAARETAVQITRGQREWPNGL